MKYLRFIYIVTSYKFDVIVPRPYFYIKLQGGWGGGGGKWPGGYWQGPSAHAHARAITKKLGNYILLYCPKLTSHTQLQTR